MLAPGDAVLPGNLSHETLCRQSGLSSQDADLLALFDAFESVGAPFTLRDLMLARQYSGLIAGGASWGTIARSVHWCGSATSLTARSLMVGGPGAIYADAGERLAELDGQLLIGFAEDQEDAEDLFAARRRRQRRQTASSMPPRSIRAASRSIPPTRSQPTIARTACVPQAGRTKRSGTTFAPRSFARGGLIQPRRRGGGSRTARCRPPLMIARRLSTIAHCDYIFMLKDGRLEGFGDYETLSRGNEAFRTLFTAAE